MTVVNKYEKTIGIVRDALNDPNGKVNDGRDGLALRRLNLAEKFDSWGKNGYYLMMKSDGQLQKSVRQWCEANGLKSESDAFNERARAAYWRFNGARMIADRSKLRLDLAQLEEAIRLYMPEDFYFIYYGFMFSDSPSPEEGYVWPVAGEDLQAGNYVVIGEDGKLYNAKTEKFVARVGVSWAKGEHVTAYIQKVEEVLYLVRQP